MRYLFLSTSIVILTACASAEIISLTNQSASKVQLVKYEPDQDKCKYISDIQGQAKAKDIAVATQSSRNDMRNKAYAMGADFVVMDTTTSANAMDWTGRTQLVLTGRAFNCK